MNRRYKTSKVTRRFVPIPNTNSIRDIDKCRKDLGIAQKFFGPAIGISHSTYSNYVREGIKLTKEEYERAISVLNRLKNIYFNLSEEQPKREYYSLATKHKQEGDTNQESSDKFDELLLLVDTLQTIVSDAKESPRKAGILSIAKLVKIKARELQTKPKQ